MRRRTEQVKFVSFEPELLTWKDLCEGIKTQQHQTPAEFQVIRFRDSSLVNNMPHLLTPGTILVLEDTRSIECVPSSEAREIWMGNNYENIRWGHSILRWNGQYLSWVGASTASVQSAKQHWDTVNCHTPGEIVQSIISGFTSKPSRMRNKRSALKKGGARSLLQDVERLQKTVGELQASIDAKDATIANLYEQLQEVTTENHALRSSQIICAIPPLHIPSLDPQHLSVESNSRLLDVPATDHCFSRRLPSSLIPTYEHENQRAGGSSSQYIPADTTRTHQERRGSLSYNWEDVASPNDVDGEGAVGMEVKEFFNEYFMPVTTEF